MSTPAQTPHAPGTTVPPITDLSSLQVNIDAKEDDNNEVAKNTAKANALSAAYAKGLTDIRANVDQCRKDGKALADRWKKAVDEAAHRLKFVLVALGDVAGGVKSAIDADEHTTSKARKSLHETEEELQGRKEADLSKAHRASEKALALYAAFQFKTLTIRTSAVETLVKEAIPKDDTASDLARQYALLYLADDWIKVIRAPDGRAINLGTNVHSFPDLEDVKGYEKLLVKYFVHWVEADVAEGQAKLDSDQVKAKLTKQTATLAARVSKRKDNLLQAVQNIDTSAGGKCPPAAQATH